ncbi:MAG: hypothetical protein NC236_01010 [Mycoplasma sp.]|nr:hypothetical protein [Mycoplasma sp.]
MKKKMVAGFLGSMVVAGTVATVASCGVDENNAGNVDNSNIKVGNNIGKRPNNPNDSSTNVGKTTKQVVTSPSVDTSHDVEKTNQVSSNENSNYKSDVDSSAIQTNVNVVNNLNQTKEESNLISRLNSASVDEILNAIGLVPDSSINPELVSPSSLKLNDLTINGVNGVSAKISSWYGHFIHGSISFQITLTKENENSDTKFIIVNGYQTPILASTQELVTANELIKMQELNEPSAKNIAESQMIVQLSKEIELVKEKSRYQEEQISSLKSYLENPLNSEAIQNEILLALQVNSDANKLPSELNLSSRNVDTTLNQIPVTLKVIKETPNNEDGTILFDVAIQNGLYQTLVPVLSSNWLTIADKLKNIDSNEIFNALKIYPYNSFLPSSVPNLVPGLITLYGEQFMRDIQNWTPNDNDGSISFDFALHSLKTGNLIFNRSMTLRGYETSAQDIIVKHNAVERKKLATVSNDQILNAIGLVPDSSINPNLVSQSSLKLTDLTINGLSGVTAEITNWSGHFAQGSISFQITLSKDGINSNIKLIIVNGYQTPELLSSQTAIQEAIQAEKIAKATAQAMAQEARTIENQIDADRIAIDDTKFDSLASRANAEVENNADQARYEATQISKLKSYLNNPLNNEVIQNGLLSALQINSNANELPSDFNLSSRSVDTTLNKIPATLKITRVTPNNLDGTILFDVSIEKYSFKMNFPLLVNNWLSIKDKLANSNSRDIFTLLKLYSDSHVLPSSVPNLTNGVMTIDGEQFMRGIQNWTPNDNDGTISFDLKLISLKTGKLIFSKSMTLRNYETSARDVIEKHNAAEKDKLDNVSNDQILNAIGLVPDSSINPNLVSQSSLNLTNLTINGERDVTAEITNWSGHFAQGSISFQITLSNGTVSANRFMIVKGFQTIEQLENQKAQAQALAQTDVTTQADSTQTETPVSTESTTKPTTSSVVDTSSKINDNHEEYITNLDKASNEQVLNAIGLVPDSSINPKSVSPSLLKLSDLTINGLSGVNVKIENWKPHFAEGSISFLITLTKGRETSKTRYVIVKGYHKDPSHVESVTTKTNTESTAGTEIYETTDSAQPAPSDDQTKLNK